MSLTHCSLVYVTGTLVASYLMMAALMLNPSKLQHAGAALRRFCSTLSPALERPPFAGTKETALATSLTVVALLFAPAFAFGQDPEAEGEARRVVILNASDPYLPAFLAIDGAMREAIHLESRVPVEFYAETLDMFRFPRTLLDDDVVALLRKKYQGLKVDVVVAAGSIALDFARSHRGDIWPGAVIVFHSVSAALLGDASLGPRTIGVPVRLELEPTLDLALSLRPGTRRIVVIAGTADLDRMNLSRARASLKRYEGRLEVQYLDGLSVAQTVAAVQALPPDSAVLYLTMFRDGVGAPQVPRHVLTRIAAASAAPVFGIYETYLGDGIAAGSITPYGAQGRGAAELVARVLNGEDPAAIGIQAPVEPRCIADWLQLGHWGIDMRLLPANCEVRFREVAAWDRYHWQILTTALVILAQAALIIALALNRRKLRRAQSALKDEYGRRKQAEALAARLRDRLARFSKERSLGTMATTIAHEINQPLIAIQNYAQAAKRRLQGDAGDKQKLIELFGKIDGQAERAGAITQRVRSLVSTSDLQLREVQLCPLLEAVIRMMEPETERQGCQILCTPRADLPTVLADALHVQLVLVNLLQNAMKFVCSDDCYDRRVSVDVGPSGDREVQVSVSDRGPGVPLDRVGDIFEPLYSGTRGGMGMGLAISRTIIDAHGGRLWYQANPEGGAIFRFTLRTFGA